MQDGRFIDRGLSHAIGQAIFVFAGGTSNSYQDFARRGQPGSERYAEFKAAKGPDFISRLRAHLDITGINLDAEFDAYGPLEFFPSDRAVKLRRAGILAYKLRERAKHLCDSHKRIHISDSVLQVFLEAPRLKHGSRSLEVLLEISSLQDATEFVSSHLPPQHLSHPHSDALQLIIPQQTSDALLAEFAKGIGTAIEGRKIFPRTRGCYRLTPTDIPRLLRAGGCCVTRKSRSVKKASIDLALRNCPQEEHDRWVANKRREGFVHGELVDLTLRTHPWLVPWPELRPAQQKLYISQIYGIGKLMDNVGLVVTRVDWQP